MTRSISPPRRGPRLACLLLMLGPAVVTAQARAQDTGRVRAAGDARGADAALRIGLTGAASTVGALAGVGLGLALPATIEVCTDSADDCELGRRLVAHAPTVALLVPTFASVGTYATGELLGGDGDLAWTLVGGLIGAVGGGGIALGGAALWSEGPSGEPDAYLGRGLVVLGVLGVIAGPVVAHELSRRAPPGDALRGQPRFGLALGGDRRGLRMQLHGCF